MTRLTFILAALLLALRPALADRAPRLEEDAGALFTWWDGLGFPDLGKAPFVRYRSGWSQAEGGLPADEGWDEGFLLDDSAVQFRVLGTDLWTRTWVKRADREDERSSYGFEFADLEATARAGIAALQPSGFTATGSKDPFCFRRQTGPFATYRALVLARACAARGLRPLASALCNLVDTAPPAGSDAAGRSRLERWKSLISGGGVRAAEGRVDNPGATWRDIRTDFARWSSGNLNESGARIVSDAVSVLDRMITEEDDAASPGAGRGGSAPSCDPVANLIAALRDPGGASLLDSDVARVSGHPPTSAAERLRQIGLPAVPRLIDALGDDRFTRHVTIWNGRFYKHLQADRVRDVALAILDDISEGALDRAHMTAKPTPVHWQEAIAVVKAWWGERKRVGEGSPNR